MSTSTPVQGPPENVAGWVGDVAAAIRANDWPKAIRWAEYALARGMEHPRLLQVRAIGRETSGNMAQALADLERANALDPEDMGVVNALGVCLARSGRLAAAVEVLEEAVRKRPDIADSWFNLGAARMDKGDIYDAEDAFQRAAHLDPGRAAAFGRLATLASHRRDTPTARAMAQRALALNAADPDGKRALIEAYLDEALYSEAEAAARTWLDVGELGANGVMHASGLLGDALEGQGRFADAFAAYSRSKAAFHALHARAFAAFEARPLSGTLKDMEDQFRTIPKSAWVRDAEKQPAQPHPCASYPRVHVFLMGFMRSGTTLLEKALARHPQVVTLEEHEAFADAGAALLNQTGGMKRLAALGDPEVERLREAYWASVHEAGVQPDGKVFIDKLPFNGVKLPLIARLFPEARIIFALRDPRDVVLSCFQRRLKANSYTCEMTTLGGAARLYARYMSLVAAYRETLPLHIHDHRHEALVADLVGELKAVCAHIDLQFDPDMIAFERSAREGKVMSQTSRQLGEGLTAKGVQHWRSYTDQLTPVVSDLAPWVEAFGYEP